MDDRLYQVRVTALATDRIPLSRIHAAYAELCCLSLPEAEARLAVLPLVVRGGLGVDLARKYERVLGRLGLRCEILPEEAPACAPPGPPSSLPAGREDSMETRQPAASPGAEREFARTPAMGGGEAGAGDAGVLAAPAGGPA